MKKEKKGFTLVELIIVIAIIALLMVVAIPSIILISNKINDKLYNSKVELILSAAEIYADDNFASLFGDGTTKTSIRVKELVPTYLEPDEVIKDPTTGEVTNKVTDPRDDSSMNERIIWLTRKNAKVVATLDEDSVIPDSDEDGDEDQGSTPEDNFDFTNGHVILAAYLDDRLYTTTHGIALPTPSVATFNAVKSRCNGGSSLAVAKDTENDIYKATISNIKKQTICMLYFETIVED